MSTGPSKSRHFAWVLAMLMLWFTNHAYAAGTCDVDADGDVDTVDLDLITLARNQSASGPDDPRDANGDGRINVADTRICTQRCTLAGCAVPVSNRAPVADAGPDQLVFTGSLVMLDGSGSSDADGDPLSFSWSIVERPASSAATLSSPADVRPTFVADEPGRYVFELVVSDGKLTSAADRVAVNTEVRNTNPVADAGPDQVNALVGTEVLLDGTGSTDVDGDQLQFSWQFISRPGGSTATLDNATAVQPRFVPDRRGLFVLRLTVSDGRGGSDSDEITVSTENADRPPVAVAGHDRSVLPGDQVCLDGSDSYDLDLDPITTYAWSFTTRPANSAAVLVGTDTSSPCFTADRRGDFVVQLVVTARAVASTPDTVIVTTANVQPVADAGPDQIVDVNVPVTLDGNGSSDANGDALAFNWTFVSKPEGSTTQLADSLTPVASFVPDVAGSFLVQLIVNDGVLDSLPDTALVSVNAQPNRPPVAVDDEATTSLGQTTLIDVLANDSDPDGDPLQISAVTAPKTGLASIEDGKIRYTPQADKCAVDQFSYTASDGQATGTANVTIVVNNNAPTAVASGPTGNVLLIDTIQLIGSGSFDPDGDNLSYEWSVIQRPDDASVTFSSATAQNPTVRVSVAGTYMFQLVVTDCGTSSSPAVLSVTVIPTPTWSVENITVAEGDAGLTPMQFTVRLSSPGGPLPKPITVEYATQALTATAGVDFEATSGTLSFPEGTPSGTSQLVTVNVIGDTDFEQDETLRLVLSNPTLSQLAEPAYGTGTIDNDDVDPASFLSLTPATQGATTLSSGQLVVTLGAAAPAGGREVNLVSDAPAIVSVPASVVVPQGQLKVQVTFTTGAESGAATITASGNGLVSDSALITVTQRVATLALDANLMGTGRQVSGTLTLATTAPDEGVTFTLASSAPDIATVSPGSVTVAPGGKTAKFTVNGLAAGVTTLSATAAGYATASVNATVTDAIINLDPIENLGVGSNRNIGLTLNQPEAADVVVTLTSSDPAVATVTPSVTIPAGQVLPSGLITLTGLSVGTAAITATAADYASDTEAVNVTLTLSFTPASTSVPALRSMSLELRLSSPAPAGGLVVDLSSDDAATATITPAQITVPQGQLSAQVSVTGVAQGSTTVRASSGLATPAAATVNVGPAVRILPISNIGIWRVGEDLQIPVGVRLEAAPPDPVTLTATSASAAVATVSNATTTVGAVSAQITNVSTTGQVTFHLSGITQGAATTVTFSAPGYQSLTLNVEVDPSGFAFYTNTDSIATNTSAANTALTVYAYRLARGTLLGSNVTQQAVRAGVTVNVEVTSSDPTVGVITTSPLQFTGGVDNLSTAFDPIGGGTTTLTVVPPPGWDQPAKQIWAHPTLAATVTAPRILPWVTNQTLVRIGEDLQIPVGVRLEAAPPDPVTLTATSASAAVATVSNATTTVGAVSAQITNVSTTGQVTFHLSGITQGAATTVTFSAPGYQSLTLNVEVDPSGFAFFSSPDNFATNTSAANTALTVYAYRLARGTLQGSNGTQQAVRAGVTVNVEVTSSDPTVGVITTSPLQFTGGVENLSTAFDPIGGGSATLTVVPPPGWDQPVTQNNARPTLTATVSAPRITVNNSYSPSLDRIGEDLMVRVSVALEAAPQPTGTQVTITATSSDPTVLLVRNSEISSGQPSDSINSVSNTSQRYFWVHGLKQGATATVTFSAPGYAPTTMQFAVDASGFITTTSNFSISKGAVDRPIVVYAARLDGSNGLNTYAETQEVRGGLTVAVNVISHDSAVGTISDSPIFVQAIADNQVSEAGRSLFDPIAEGETVIEVVPPAGWEQPANGTTDRLVIVTVTP